MLLDRDIINADGKFFEVNNWKVSQFIVKYLLPIVGTSPYPLNELTLMVGAVLWIKPTHIFEWGTHVGKSARIFYEVIHNYGIDCEIHSIDLPDDVDHIEHPKGQRGRFVLNKKVSLHQGNGIDTSLKIYKKIKKPSKVLFYLDGDHAFSTVYHELSLITKNIPSATILIHDTFFQSKISKYNVGPYKAISELLKNKRVKFEKIETKTGLPGMTLLYHLKKS